MSSNVMMKNNKVSLEIETLGAQIKYIKGASGKQYLWCGDPEVWALKAPVLFPICGGLKDDKFVFEGKEYSLMKHGYGRFKNFEIESCHDDTAVFLHKSDDETKELYPFDYEFRIIYKLCGNELHVTYSTKNVSDKTMYFSVGAHEGYACPEGIEEYNIVFDKTETLDACILDGTVLSYETKRILENDNILPLSYELCKMDSYVFKKLNSRKVSLVHKNGEKVLDVEFEGHDYLLLWTKPDAGYICIEPWCGIPDSVDSNYDITTKEGIIALEPGETHEACHIIRVEE